MKGPRDDRRVEAAPRESHTLIAGRYEVLEELGDGPAGTTYKARHALLGNLLSVTVLPAALTDDPPQLALVQDAVRRAVRLRHDHIVPVLDFGEEAKRYHLVEAFDDAEPLDRVLREGGPLAAADALHVARQLADTLAYTHESGAVHGALAPGTVRIRREAPPHAMLSGFATAALGALVPYSAPEQLAGSRTDPRSDVFALGLLVFEMLLGKRFFGGSDDQVRDVLLHGKAPLLPQFSCIMPSGVSGLVGRALRRSPAHRQQSMAQVRSEIDACLRRLGERNAEAKAPVSGLRPVRRHPIIVVDEALEEPATEVPAAPTSDRSATRPPRRVAVRVEPASREQGIPDRVLVRATGRATASRRRLPIASVMLIGAVGLAASWPILRAPTVVPAAPDAASRPVDPPAASALPSATAILEPAPEPASPGPVALVADEEAPAPAAPATVPDPVAPPQEAGQTDAAARETPAVAEPEPVPHVAPRIVSRWPRRRDALRVTEGAALDFGVRAASEKRDARLAYAWFVDGRRVGRRERWRFLAPPAATATAHTVEVQVSDGAGLKAPRVSWTVGVTPRMREVDVRDWLDRLASAWERRDLATLRLYGIVADEKEAAAIRKRLPRGKDHHVAIGVETIRTQAQYAAVAFDRAEFDARGKLVSSARESYELEKQASGFVALRAR